MPELTARKTIGIRNGILSGQNSHSKWCCKTLAGAPLHLLKILTVRCSLESQKHDIHGKRCEFLLVYCMYK